MVRMMRSKNKKSPYEIKDLPIKDIAPDPLQPRDLFDDDKINALAESIKNQGLLQPILVRPLKDRKYKLRDVEKLLRKFLSHTSVSIISTPHNIDIEELIHMSVNKIKPFEETGEKGFRDSVILFTIFEHAKNERNGSHLLVANDGVYQESDVTMLAEKHNVKLLVAPSIQKAHSMLEEFLGDATKEEIEEINKFLINLRLE